MSTLGMVATMGQAPFFQAPAQALGVQTTRLNRYPPQVLTIFKEK